MRSLSWGSFLILFGCNAEQDMPSPPPTFAPVLSQVQPRSGPSTGGTNIQIIGEHFAEGMTVTFQGAAATGVVRTSEQTLQAVLPALPGVRGFVPVTISQPNAQPVSRSDLFFYYPGTVKFDPAVHLPVDSLPQMVAVADLNRDGHLDLATASFGADKVGVRLGKGDGTFLANSSTTVGKAPIAVQVADLNGDSKPDVLSANYFDGSISVLLGKGDGTFQAANNLTTGAGASSIAVGFVDGDSIPDLAITNRDANNVTILLGKGDGTFRAGPILVAPSCTWAAFGDLGSGRLADLVVANDANPQFSVFRIKSDGSYNAPLLFDVSANPRSLALGDFNHDGRLDVAVANFGDTRIGVLLGVPGTLFAPVKFLELGNKPYTVSLGDVNGDGELDIVTGNPQSDNVSLLFGVGDGSFQKPVHLTAHTGPRHVGIGDFDGDGLADLAAVNFTTSDLSILLNRSQ